MARTATKSWIRTELVRIHGKKGAVRSNFGSAASFRPVRLSTRSTDQLILSAASGTLPPALLVPRHIFREVRPKLCIIVELSPLCPAKHSHSLLLGKGGIFQNSGGPNLTKLSIAETRCQ